MEKFWREVLDEYGISMPPSAKRNRNFDFYLGCLSVQANKRPNLTADSYIRRRLFENDMNYVIRDALRIGKRKKEKEDHTLAFIWDLDDITMMSRERMVEISQQRPDVDSMSLQRLFDKLSTIVDVAHPDEIEAKYVMNIEDALYAEQYSPRYYVMKNLYSEITEKDEDQDSRISHGKEQTVIDCHGHIEHLPALLERCGMTENEAEICETASKIQEIQNQRWRKVKKSLDLVNRRSAESRDHNFANVVISKEGIVHAANELLITRHASSIAIENIYSTYYNKKSVWHRIRRKFGEHCRLVYITSNEHPILPKNMSIQVCPLNADECIEGIYNCQEALLK